MTTPVLSAPKAEQFTEMLRTIVFAVLLAMIFRSFLYEPFHIPSGSMKPNLEIGDYLFVSKFTYGYSRYSFPFGAQIDYFDGRILGGTPERGDVVVFRKPTQPTIDFIKRVVGLPGDQIQVRDGVLYINDVAVPREKIDDYVASNRSGNRVKRIARFIETLPNGVAYEVLDETRFGLVDRTMTFMVPQGHYFMMGDNRDNSTDSRYMDEVGFVPEENLVGPAEIVVFSSGGPNFFRGERFLKLVP